MDGLLKRNLLAGQELLLSASAEILGGGVVATVDISLIKLYFQPFSVEWAFFIDSFVGMSAEVVSLGLNHIST